MYPINVVEKETNISKYLLRMWERRYAFPRPGRDENGERLYTDDDVTKLKLVKKLMIGGYRPSKIIDRPILDLQSMLGSLHASELPKGPEIVILVTSLQMQGEVLKRLKDQDVKEVFMINNLEDLSNLDL